MCLFRKTDSRTIRKIFKLYAGWLRMSNTKSPIGFEGVFGIAGLLLGPIAVEHFDRSDKFRGLYEAALVVNQTNLHRDRNVSRFVKDKFYLLDERGFIGWILSPFPSEPGILNYKEDVRLEQYEQTMQEFIEHRRLFEDTAGFMAMDAPSASALEHNGNFDPGYLHNYFIGIDKRLIAS